VPLSSGGRTPTAAATTPRTRWPVRRVQTFLRALGIDIAFSREDRAGSRTITIRATQENIVSTVSSVCDSPAPRPAGNVCGLYPMGPGRVTTANDADGADAKSRPSFRF
jgi:hypothetical protein